MAHDLTVEEKMIQARGLLEQQLDFGFSRNHAEHLAECLSIDEQMADLDMTRSDLRRMLFGDAELQAAFQTRLDALFCTPTNWEHESTPAALHIEKLITRDLRSIICGWFESLELGYSVQALKLKPEEFIDEHGNRVIALDEQGNMIPAKEDGFISFIGIASKPIEHFKPALDGGLCLQNDPQFATGTLDPNIYILTVNNFSEKNPYGHSLLADLHRTWYDRNSVLQYHLYALERYTAPFIVGKIEDGEKFDRDMTRQGIKNYVRVGEKDTVEQLLNGLDASLSQVAQEFADTYNRVVLGSTLTTTAGGGGSLSQSETHERVREDKSKADIFGVVEVVNKIIRAFWNLNNLSEDMPKFIMGPERQIDFDRVKLDAEMVNVHGVRFSKEYLLRTYGYEDDDLEIEGQAELITQLSSQQRVKTLTLTRELQKAIEFDDIQEHVHG